jgi:hypothetical protein
MDSVPTLQDLQIELPYVSAGGGDHDVRVRGYGEGLPFCVGPDCIGPPSGHAKAYGAWSASATITVPISMIPPIALKVSAIESTAATVSWTRISEQAEKHLVLVEFVRYLESATQLCLPAPTVKKFVVEANNTDAALIPDLVPSAQYRVYVSAATDQVEGPLSVPVLVTTAKGGPPAPEVERVSIVTKCRGDDSTPQQADDDPVCHLVKRNLCKDELDGKGEVPLARDAASEVAKTDASDAPATGDTDAEVGSVRSLNSFEQALINRCNATCLPCLLGERGQRFVSIIWKPVCAEQAASYDIILVPPGTDVAEAFAACLEGNCLGSTEMETVQGDLVVPIISTTTTTTTTTEVDGYYSDYAGSDVGESTTDPTDPTPALPCLKNTFATFCSTLSGTCTDDQKTKFGNSILSELTLGLEDVCPAECKRPACPRATIQKIVAAPNDLRGYVVAIVAVGNDAQRSAPAVMFVSLEHGSAVAAGAAASSFSYGQKSAVTATCLIFLVVAMLGMIWFNIGAKYG